MLFRSFKLDKDFNDVAVFKHEYYKKLHILKGYLYNKFHNEKNKINNEKVFENICNNILKERYILLIYKSIIDYYNSIASHSYISKDELVNYISINYTTYKDLPTIISMVDSIYNMDISDSLSKDIVTKLIEKDISNKIINKLLPVITENKFSILSTIEEEDRNNYTNSSRNSVNCSIDTVAN